MNKQQESVEEMEKQVETRCALFKMKYKLLFQDFIFKEEFHSFVGTFILETCYLFRYLTRM